MNKLLSREIDFIFDPTYSKINKKIDLIIKELTGIFGNQYKELFKNRINNTNFVFYNKITDLEKYIDLNKDLFLGECDKTILNYYNEFSDRISKFNDDVSSLKNKLRSKFILDVCDFLNYDDQSYIRNHKKIDYSRLCCYPLFFSENSSKLIDGLINYFSNEAESKFRDSKTSILELERIVNNRELCLKLLGIRNVNLNSFDISTISDLLEIVEKYNDMFDEEFNLLNLDKKYLVNNYLIGKNLVNKVKNSDVKKSLEYMISNDNEYVKKINDEIIDILYKVNEPIYYHFDDKHSGEKVKFLLFSPCMNYEYLDFLFVRTICRIAIEPDFESQNADDAIFGNDRYSYFNRLLFDYLSYEILKNINLRGSKLICFNMNLNIHELNDGLFLISKFYEMYSNVVFESMMENSKFNFYNLVGDKNFENYIDIVNKYYSDCDERVLSNKGRRVSGYVEMIRNILNISLSNMEQYRKILLNKERYDSINNNI